MRTLVFVLLGALLLTSCTATSPVLRSPEGVKNIPEQRYENAVGYHSTASQMNIADEIENGRKMWECLAYTDKKMGFDEGASKTRMESAKSFWNVLPKSDLEDICQEAVDTEKQGGLVEGCAL